MARGKFDARGYRHARYPVGFRYEMAETRHLIAGEWQLRNYEMDRRGGIVAKTGKDFRELLWLELESEWKSVGYFPVLDLHFEHIRNDGEIWVMIRPVPPELAAKDPSTLVDRYVENLSGARYGSPTPRRPMPQPVQIVERRYATRLASISTLDLAGRTAASAVVDVANVDQLKMTPGAIERRIKLVVLLPGLELEYRLGKTRSVMLPLMITIGYMNRPDDFDRHVGEFDAFVDNLETFPEPAG